MTGEGIPGLMKTVNDLLKASDILNQQPAAKVFRPLPRHKQVSITKDGDVFVVSEPELERIVSRVDMSDTTIQGQILGHWSGCTSIKHWKTPASSAETSSAAARQNGNGSQ